MRIIIRPRRETLAAAQAQQNEYQQKTVKSLQHLLLK